MDPRSVDECWVNEWMDAGWVGDRVRQWQWLLGECRLTLFSRSGHLDAVTCHAPLTWVGSSVSSILAMELKLTGCLVVINTIILISWINNPFFSYVWISWLWYAGLRNYDKYSFLLTLDINKWFQTAHRDCFCYPLDWSSSCFKDEHGNLLICTNTNAI